MKKVWSVSSGEYESYGVEELYSTRERAEYVSFILNEGRSYGLTFVEEFDFDPEGRDEIEIGPTPPMVEVWSIGINGPSLPITRWREGNLEYAMADTLKTRDVRWDHGDRLNLMIPADAERMVASKHRSDWAVYVPVAEAPTREDAVDVALSIARAKLIDNPSQSSEGDR